MTIEELEQAYQLGDPLGTYRYKLLNNLFISLSLAAGGIGFLFLSLILMMAWSSPGATDPNALKTWVIFLSIPILIGCVGAYEAFSRRSDRQILYEQGLVEVKRGKADALLYDEIANIFQAQTDTYYDQNIAIPLTQLLVGSVALPALAVGKLVTAGRDRSSSKQDGGSRAIYTYTFELSTGKRKTSPFKEVGEHIKALIFPQKLQQMAQCYAQGETLTFGPISLNSAGLSHRNKTLAWTDFKDVWSDGTQRLHIKRQTQSQWNRWRDDWAVLELKMIPNLEVFVILVKQLQKTAGVLTLEV